MSAAAVRTERRDRSSEIWSYWSRRRRRRIQDSSQDRPPRCQRGCHAKRHIVYTLRAVSGWTRDQRAFGRGYQPGGAKGKQASVRPSCVGVTRPERCRSPWRHTSLSESHKPARRRTAGDGPCRLGRTRRGGLGHARAARGASSAPWLGPGWTRAARSARGALRTSRRGAQKVRGLRSPAASLSPSTCAPHPRVLSGAERSPKLLSVPGPVSFWYGREPYAPFRTSLVPPLSLCPSPS